MFDFLLLFYQTVGLYRPGAHQMFQIVPTVMLMQGVSAAKATLDAVFANMDLLEMVKTAKVPHARPSCLGPFCLPR